MTTPEDFAALAQRVNNWGRWGSDDRRGTLNLIEAEAVLRGQQCVRKGLAFNLSSPWPGRLPAQEEPRRKDGAAERGALGRLSEPEAHHWPYRVDFPAWRSEPFGRAQLTSLQATSHAGRMYNGFEDAVLEQGPPEDADCSLESDCVVSRAVLLDAARAAGVDWLSPGHELSPQDLQTALALAGTRLYPGDLILLRTGHIEHLLSGSLPAYFGVCPGLSVDSVEWLHSNQVAAICIDSWTIDALSARDEASEAVPFPVRLLLSVEVGMPQGTNFDFQLLGKFCDENSSYSMLLVASPVGRAGSGDPCAQMVSSAAIL